MSGPHICTPSKQAFNQFSKLIKTGLQPDAPDLSWAIKDTLQPSLVEAFGMSNNRVVPLVWKEFLTQINAHFRVGKLHEVIEWVQEDIQAKLLNVWTFGGTRSHKEIALAAYYFAHISSNGEMRKAATDIDQKVLGSPFSERFGAPVPLTEEDVIGLSKKTYNQGTNNRLEDPEDDDRNGHNHIPIRWYGIVAAALLISVTLSAYFYATYDNVPTKNFHQAEIKNDIATDTPPGSDTFKIALDHEKAGREDDRVSALLQASHEGNPTAELELAFSDYRTGSGSELEADFNEISNRHDMISRAEEGDAEARYFYGLMLMHGLSIGKDVSKAHTQLVAAMNQGIVRSAIPLAILILDHKNIAPKCAGFSYASRAEDSGYLIAKWILARYLKDYSCPAKMGTKQKAIRDAISNLNSAIEVNGNAKSQNLLGVMYKEGIGFAKSDESDTEAFKLFEQAAEKGNLDAKNNLGVMYAQNRGVEINAKNEREAVRLFRETANLGNARGQYSLGWMYMKDRVGDDKNADEEAFRLLNLAVSQGHVSAKIDLAWLYRQGRGVERNYEEALRLYEEAALAGNNLAKINLGYMYISNLGAPKSEQNKETAFKWYKDAAETSAQAQYQLGEMYLYNQGVPEGDDIDAKALKWLTKSAEQDYPAAINGLGVLYEHGRGVEKSLVQAHSYYVQASRLGSSIAKTNLGWLYTKDVLFRRDYGKALQYFTDAEKAGDEAATAAIGYLYAYGHGVPKNFTEAERRFEKAAASGDSYAQFYLGQAHRLGWIGKSVDFDKAVDWYRQAAEQGHQRAQYQLGLMYKRGRVVPEGPENDRLAADWFQKASNQGNGYAQFELAQMYAKKRGVPTNVDADAKAFELFKKALPKTGVWELRKLAEWNTLYYKNNEIKLLSQITLEKYIEEKNTNELSEIFSNNPWYYLSLMAGASTVFRDEEHPCGTGAAYYWCFDYTETELHEKMKAMSQAGVWEASFTLVFHHYEKGDCEEANRYLRLAINSSPKPSNRFKYELANVLYEMPVDLICNRGVDATYVLNGLFEAVYEGYNAGDIQFDIDPPAQFAAIFQDLYPSWIAKFEKKSIDDNNSDWWLTLGRLYAQGGPGIYKQPKIAESWFERAVNAGKEHASFELAKLYVNDFNPPRTSEAISLISANKEPKAAIEELEQLLDRVNSDSNKVATTQTLNEAISNIKRNLQTRQ
ncbi:tetratricopeptide repeat protein [Cohaesibacter sp. CAU 1516]|uniref:SEL1-like repeat protein n=1 Tax=Cohaesibacter sp. CAU 1516 TaxID=2576038 RepID=UPI0014854008|nr:tetratricopeptide repeat protein [Cohaesibacter sp. CAU 1516]